uniref:Uncharacterized protein n=1 Tax=viral metagenome TaxID=1070528 RepID=A0A6C0CA68_9ZZZZ
MNLVKILSHDTSTLLMDYFSLETILILNRVTKKIPDLTKHHKIKTMFQNEFFRDQQFFTKFRKNDKLISCIYKYKIVFVYDFIYSETKYDVIKYYSDGNCELEKLYTSIINGDLSYVYFYLFACDYQSDVTQQSIAKLFSEHNNSEIYEKFTKQYHGSGIIEYPWFTIATIIKDGNMIKKILELYNNCTYYYEIYNLGAHGRMLASFELWSHSFLYERIIINYPELKELVDSVIDKGQKMKQVTHYAYWNLPGTTSESEKYNWTNQKYRIG